MKLKSALKTLYDTVKSPALRADAVTFLRRYSKDYRTITHYACRGAQTETITGLLKSLGFEEDKDFAVVSSSFDPQSNSIRFLDDAKIALLANDIMSSSYDYVFDMMYATVAHPDTAAILACFRDADDDAVRPPVQPPAHFAKALLARSDELLDRICGAPDVPDADKPQYGANAQACLAAAKRWAEANRGKPVRPYVLPLAVLEAAYRLDHSDAKAPWLFLADHPLCEQRTRLARHDESVPVLAMREAPIRELEEGPGNPLHGYFCNTAEGLESADLSNKAGVFAVCDAPMVFGEGPFDDVLSPVQMAMERDRLWHYIQVIYEACYGSVAGNGFPTFSMRIAISDDSETWWPTMGLPGGGCVGHNRNRLKTPKEAMVAKYTVLLTDFQVSDTYSHMSNMILSCSTPTVLASTPDGAPDYTGCALAKDEVAWEWFVMTHRLPGTPHHTWSASGAPGDLPQADVNFSEFRRWKAAVKPAALARLSRPADNPGLQTELCTDGEYKFTPLSAFVEGAIPLALRLHAADGRTLPCRDWGGPDPDRHGRDTIVAGVYSGVCTDKSPSVGGDNPDGVFERPTTFSLGDAVCVFDDCDCRSRVTDWLTRLSSDEGSVSQVKFAKRTRGTPREAVLIVETNVDAEEFCRQMGNDGAARLADRLRAAFAQTVLLRNDTPYCVTDESMGDRFSGLSPLIDGHRYLKKDYGTWYDASLADATNFEGISPDRVSVGSLVDSYGRLVLVFSVSGDDFTYARMCFRWTREFPLATAGVRSQADTLASNTLLVPPGSRGDFGNVVRFMHLMHQHFLHQHFRSSDYVGAADHSPHGGEYGPMHREPFAGVEPGTAPSRTFFTSRGQVSVGDMIVTP